VTLVVGALRERGRWKGDDGGSEQKVIEFHLSSLRNPRGAGLIRRVAWIELPRRTKR
jgi:hypothetical protein